MNTSSPQAHADPKAQRPANQGNGGKLLDEVHAFITKYVVFPKPEQADAVTLWVVHTHAFDAAETTPRLSIQSAEKQSGKTRLLEIIDLLAREPLQTASISAAALFRVISAEEGGTPTLLVDEVDTVFSARGKGREDLRGLLNAGYRRGSSVMRVCGNTVDRFPVFAPCALAGIGRLPDTVQDRSIVIRLKRRASTEPVTKLRRREVDADAFTLRSAVDAWASDNLGALSGDVPAVPDELGDRAADVWEPLLSIGNRAGGGWAQRAYAAAIELSARGADDADTESESTALLGDAWEVFTTLHVDRIPSMDLIRRLRDIDIVRWGTIDARELAAGLKRFDIGPRVVRKGEEVFRGYLSRDFDDAVGRYL